MPKPKPAPVELATPLPTPSIMSRVTSRVTCGLAIPTGFLPFVFYASYAALLPLLYFFVSTYDYSENVTRGMVIGLTSALPVVAYLAADCCTWFNMALFLHTAIEAKLLDTAITFATADGTAQHHMAWAWVGAAVVMAHLLPFFLFDNARLHLLLASVGIPVNATIAVFIDPAFLPVVVPSATFFLLLVLICPLVEGVKTSLLGKFLAATRSCEWIACRA